MAYDTVAKMIPQLSYTELVNLLSVVAENIKARNLEHEATDTYPRNYFSLFGSDPSYPEPPEEVPACGGRK